MSAFSIYVIVVTLALVAVAILADRNYRGGLDDEEHHRKHGGSRHH